MRLCITLEAEILEIKPRVNTQTHESFIQAIVDIGYLDTNYRLLYLNNQCLQ
jgi:predicted amino acid racemase